MNPTHARRGATLPQAERPGQPLAALVLALMLPWMSACDVPDLKRPDVKWGVPRACTAETKLHLAKLGIPAAAVRDITLRTDETSGRGSSRISGHQAWVRLNACQGHVILNLHRECGLQTAYTTPDCKVPGLEVR